MRPPRAPRGPQGPGRPARRARDAYTARVDRARPRSVLHPAAMLRVLRRRARARLVPSSARVRLVRARVARLVAALAVVALAFPADAQRAAARPAAAAAVDPRIGLVRDRALADALGLVDAARIRATDSALVAFGTRHTMSDTLSATRGIGAARRWIHARLTEVSAACGNCLRVTYDAAPVVVARHPQRPTVNVVNVLATLPGRDTSRVIVVGGHFDSCICSVDPFDATSDAPGADDDGSGTAAVMELARVFAARYPQGLDATVIFALYAGEEQGLLGSNHLAERLHAEGKTVVAAITNDIVGNVEADDGTRDDRTLRAFTPDPDNGVSREFGRYAWATTSVYQPGLALVPVFRLDRIGRGGDHAPFARRGDAGLRFTERLENYKRQHLPTDDLAHVDFAYVAKVAKVNGALVGALAQAPATPAGVTVQRDRASGGQKWRLGWQPVPNATGYEIVWRSSVAPTWERIVPVAAGAAAHVLDEQLDDGWAGVRAVGANGHRSMVAVVPAPPPSPPPATPAAR